MPWPAIAAAIGGAAQGASDLVGNIYNNQQSNRQRHWEEDMYHIAQADARLNLQLQQQWEEYMNQTNNQFASDEALKAHERSKELLKMQQEYNTMITDPAYIMQRAKEAGLNPSVYMSGQIATGSGGSAPSGASASPSGHSGVGVPSVAYGGYSTMPFQPGSVSQGMREMAEGLLSLARAKSEGINTERMEATFDSFVKQQQAAADLTQAEANLQKFVEPMLKGSQAALNWSLREQAIQNAYKVAAEGDESQARKLLYEAQIDTEKALQNLHGWQSKLAEKAVRFADSEHRAKIANLYAQSNMYSATANLTNEQRSQLEAMHDDLVMLKRFETDEAFVRSEIAARTLDDAVAVIRNNKLASDKEVKILEQKLRDYKAQNDLRAYHEAVDLIERINNGLTAWIPLAPDRTSTATRSSWSPSGMSTFVESSRSKSFWK